MTLNQSPEKDTRAKGRDLPWILFSVFLLLLIFWPLVTSSILKPSFRSWTARSKADMRTFSNSLEVYYVENNNKYPPWSSDYKRNAFALSEDKRSNREKNRVPGDEIFRDQPTFVLGHVGCLTTPTAYMPSFTKDEHSRNGLERTFSYYSVGDGWILWSIGPDQDYDLSLKNINSAYDPQITQPSTTLLLYSYDPSNGIESSGDVFRAKQ